MDGGQEGEHIEAATNIEWRKVGDTQELGKLISDTLEETIFQKISAVSGTAELLQIPLPRFQSKRDQNTEAIRQNSLKALQQIRRLQELLRADGPLPISNKYKDRPIIDLNPDLEPPV